MSWGVDFTARAEKQLKAVEPGNRARILKSLARLAADPFRAAQAKKLSGGGFRLRVGSWRVLYELQDDRLVVLVIRIAHRREAYRRRR